MKLTKKIVLPPNDGDFGRNISVADFDYKSTQTFNEIADVINENSDDMVVVKIHINIQDNTILTMLERIKYLEEQVSELMDLNKPLPEVGSFLRNVVNKIEILKNKIKKDLPAGDLFSINLSEVEAVEDEILAHGKVTEKQLRKLNEIHSRISK